MPPRLTIVTLGVADLERAAGFYTSVGFERPPGPDGIVFLRTRGSVLALFGWDELAADADLHEATAMTDQFRGVTLASNQDSRGDVDEVYAQWIAAGAVPVKPPQEVFWGGYSCYVRDLDGHLWEFAHNPFLTLAPDGSLMMHE